MLLFVIFLFCDLLMVGVFFAVYGGKRPYAEGMLLGVHLPREAAEQAEVVALMDTFRRRTRRFYLVNLILGVAVCLVTFWRFSPFLILWCLWLVEFVIGAQWLLLGTHRTLYDLKMARGWVVGEPATLAAADTRASAQRRGPGLVWHLLPCGLILTTLLLPGVRDFLLTQGSGWGLLGSGLAISLTLWALHAVLSRRGNKVYSQDTAVNQAVNRLERQVWGWTLLLSSLFNAAACWSAAWWMARAHWVGHTAYGIYLVLELLPAAIFLTGMLWMARRRRQILAADPVPLVVDDDVYWRKGWYENPNDPRWLVQDRLVPYNYSMNMAKPGAWGGTIALLAGVGILLVGLCVLFLWADFGGSSVSITSERVAVSAFLYDTEVAPQDIRSVTLLEALPEDDYVRTNGLDDGRRLIGHFRGRETGPCEMYLYTAASPILAVETGRAPSISTARTPPRPKPGTQTCWPSPPGCKRPLRARPDLLHLSLDALPGQRV